MLNAHDRLDGRLWEPDGTHWNCKFQDEIADRLASAWRRTVTVSGTVNPMKREILVDELIIEDAGDNGMSAETHPFWEEVALAALEAHQRVRIVERIEDLAADWSGAPLDEDPLAEVLEERRRRRAATRATA